MTKKAMVDYAQDTGDNPIAVVNPPEGHPFYDTSGQFQLSNSVIISPTGKLDDLTLCVLDRKYVAYQRQQTISHNSITQSRVNNWHMRI